MMSNLQDIPSIDAMLASLAQQSQKSFRRKTSEMLQKVIDLDVTKLVTQVETRLKQPASSPAEMVQQQRHVIAMFNYKKDSYGLVAQVQDLKSIADRYEAITNLQGKVPEIEEKLRLEFNNLKWKATNPEQIRELSALLNVHVAAKIQELLPVERVIEKGRFKNVSPKALSAPLAELITLVGAMNACGPELSKAMVEAYDRGMATTIRKATAVQGASVV